MKQRLLQMLLLCVLVPMMAVATLAQGSTATPALTPTPEPIPQGFRLNNVRYEAQTWNNCGPATLTNALSFFGYQNNQKRAADWLKPNYEDKNVSPWQMAQFVNERVPELNVFAMVRVGGSLDLLKRLIANDFPVIIEKGYDPEPQRLGWMGHYLLVVGYDDRTSNIITHDSYIGANTNYSYEYTQQMWQHFNYTYLVLYPANRYERLTQILGDNIDDRQNVINALEIARAEAIAKPDDAFAWFNMGTNFLALEMYREAAVAYDQARSFGLPWRMLWYQFGPFEAYYQVGRYDDMLTLAQANLNDGGGQYVEETYYYGGLARAGKGERDRALANFEAAISFNPNFTPAVEARRALLGN